MKMCNLGIQEQQQLIYEEVHHGSNMEATSAQGLYIRNFVKYAHIMEQLDTSLWSSTGQSGEKLALDPGSVEMCSL